MISRNLNLDVKLRGQLSWSTHRITHYWLVVLFFPNCSSCHHQPLKYWWFRFWALNNEYPAFFKTTHFLGLWDQRIPLLQHYLEQTKSIDQDQWEEWLLALMDDTLAEIDLDEWNTALIGAMTQHLSGLYSGPEQSKEKTFLMKAMGRALKATKSGNRYLSNGHTEFLCFCYY